MTGVTAVMFGSTRSTNFVVPSSGQIVAVAPPGAVGTVDITVVGPNGTSAAVPADQYTYTGATMIQLLLPPPPSRQP